MKNTHILACHIHSINVFYDIFARDWGQGVQTYDFHSPRHSSKGNQAVLHTKNHENIQSSHQAIKCIQNSISRDSARRLSSYEPNKPWYQCEIMHSASVAKVAVIRFWEMQNEYNFTLVKPHLAKKCRRLGGDDVNRFAATLSLTRSPPLASALAGWLLSAARLLVLLLAHYCSTWW